MRKTIVIGLGGVAAAVLAVSGVATAMASNNVATRLDDGPSPSASVSVSPSVTPSVSPSADDGSVAVTADQARAIATSVVPGGVVREIELRDGNTWKVHLNAPDGQYEVLIDATTGAVVKLERSGGAVDGATGGATGSPSPTRGGDDDRGRNRGRGGDDDDDHSGPGRGGNDDHGDDDHGSGGHGSDD